MESVASSNNKRIAKNTFLLYLRMLVVMLVGLYTSRVVLDTLGVVDYGIYNVVGGIVVLFSFINYAMTNATQRYLAFWIGKNDNEKLSSVFSCAAIIHLLIAFLILILSETIGLWMMYHQMNIPDERFSASLWVFHISVLSSLLMTINVPFNSAIIAHEDMNFFAYVSIFEAISKLLIVYCILVINYDKLIVYAILLFVVQLIVFNLYRFFCKRHYKELHISFTIDKSLFKEMTSFATWSLFGNLAYVLSTQGVNILLNILFGPAVNAARGVAVQVKSVINQISTNFQMAINPQITKSYANTDIPRMHTLVQASSKYSFFLLLFFTVPLFFEAPQVLNIWLVDVPEYTVSFLRIILCTIILDVTSNSLAIAVQATGIIRQYQSVVGSINLLIVPLSYVGIKLWGRPDIVFYVDLVICVVAQLVRLYFVKKYISLGYTQFFMNVVLPCFLVTFISIIPSICLYYIVEEGFLKLIIDVLLSSITIFFSVYFLGINKQERELLKSFIHSKVAKFRSSY